MSAELAAALARRREYLAAKERFEEAQAALEQKRELAARWRREVGAVAERLEAAKRPLKRLRAVFGGGGDYAPLEAELVAARAKHDEADDAIPALERARDEAAAAAGELEGAPAAFAELLAAREEELRERGGEVAERLQASSDALFALEEECELLSRVMQLGRDAEGELLVGKQCLKLARQAVGADVIGGAVGVGKVPALKDAERHLQAAARSLEQMGNQMEERAAVMRRITFPTGQHLADMLFDKLPYDLFVHRRIHQVADDVATTIEQLRAALWAGEAAYKQLVQKTREASDQRAAWIVDAR